MDSCSTHRSPAGNCRDENILSKSGSGHTWTLVHNGTIFECYVLNCFIHEQQGGTDSERILCYIVNRVNERQEQKGWALSREERFQMLDGIVGEIAPENKINLLIYDGELLYAHTNYRESLYKCKKGRATVISTRPLDRDTWEELPMNTLSAYREGSLLYTGTNHGNEFVDSEEKMRLLFLDFANL